MEIFKKQVNYPLTIKNKIYIAFILGSFLSFIIIFLEPFDTNNYYSKYKTLILCGYGILFFLYFIIQSLLEDFIYSKLNYYWSLFNEILSILCLLLVSGSIFYLYNHLFINASNYSLESHISFYKNIVLVFSPILFPVTFYLKNKLGKINKKSEDSETIIYGRNKNEIIRLQKDKIIYVKSIENYIEIFYLDSNDEIVSRTIRQTLTNIHTQLNFLAKCHRSYLININNIKEIRGNSQNAKIFIKNKDFSVPLSKTFYNKIFGLYQNLSSK